MKNSTVMFALGFIAALVAACHHDTGVGGATSDATRATQEANAKFAAELKLDDPQDFDDAKRGFIAKPTGQVKGEGGAVLIDFDAWSFITEPVPPTVNPSLWRHARLNAQTGLFKVTDGIWQLRGFDISNMTLIEGKTGWIVVDPLTAREAAETAIKFARAHLGDKPVSAMIFTHSHVDHFGGVLGVVTAEEAAKRKLPVVAPDGFIEEATSENVLVGTGMSRRSMYQFGKNLERSAKGFVDSGLGKSVAYGTIGILQPTQLITQATQELTLDGVRFVFHNVPSTEAPAEMTFEVPERHAYCGAEIVVQTLHNLLPIRGAKVRDSKVWSEDLDAALTRLDGIDVYFASHTWPIWGRERIQAFITAHRDVYRYLHDQTVRMINEGYTANQIADQIRLPKSLAQQLGARGYYGDVRHNVKAIYQYYMGIYDGNPAHLNPLPPETIAPRYVELMGGADKVIVAAHKAYDAGDYRWAAELLNHIMFADPSNADAKVLLAQVYEQMGYMSESATWRNSYLTGAAELRGGPPQKGVNRAALVELLAQTPVERFLDAMAGSLNGEKADGVNLKINLVLTDAHQSYVLWIENAVLHHATAPAASDATATLSLTKAVFLKMVTGTASAKDMLLGDDVKVSGSRIDLVHFFSLLDKAPGTFAIVTK